jgi:hypothetical protein
MKKILLTCIVAMSIFAVDAQTKKSSKKAKKPTKEAIAKAKFNKQEEQKKFLRDSTMTAWRGEDSLRLVTDSLADVQKDSMRMAYRDAGSKFIDSTSKEKYAALARERDQQDKAERANYELSKSAKLSDYEAKQVKVINQTYNERAKAITDNASLDDTQKKTQLVALNEERMTRIRAVAGKAGAKKFEKERKEFVQKNGADSESAWIDQAESVVKNN